MFSTNLETSTMATFDYNLEYRSMKDNAWYTCGILIEEHGKQLRVKLKDFIQSYNDEVFTIADLSSHNKLHELLDRFRPVSEPVEDNECSTVIEGMLVCAIYRGQEEMLYFDAIVDAVLHKEHTPGKCLCSYLLFWQHGPGKGNITATTLEDICLIKHNAILPKLAEFINIVKQKLETSSNENPDISQDFGSRNGSYAGRKRSFPELTDHDMDLGGVKTSYRHHYILLENLDKDLCPLLMMDFIHEHTSITAQTYVFPSLLAETYARGAIVVDSSTKLKRICEFINNPNHFITSFSGRPWVVAEGLKSGTFNTNLQNLQLKYKNYSRKNELKVVRLGTEEYRKSKQLKDLYLEFRNHLKGLLQRLAVEEKNQGESVSTNCKNAVFNGRCRKGARGAVC